jgi:small nuclear ribonucleoprotein (snRNP)-like protein
MRRVLVIAVLSVALSSQANAQGPAVSATDTTHTVVAAHKGKRVTLRLRSGQEVSGTVRSSSEKLVVLEAVSGREFFDAVIPVDAIEAIFVRTR